MNRKISVMIVDDNESFVNLVVEAINKEDDMYVCGQSYDGNDAIQKILQLKPQLILLDIIMPKKDGIAVLEAIKDQLNYKPIIIMLTAIGQEGFIKKAIDLGAQYYILKPFGKETLINRIRQINSFSENVFSVNDYINGIGSLKEEKTIKDTVNPPMNSTNKDFAIKKATSKLMHDFGIPIHMMGYNYLSMAVVEAVKDPTLISCITKKLYPIISEYFNTTPTKVERAIRGALTKAWQRRFTNNNFCFEDNNNVTIRPTNSEFIATLADRVRTTLEQEGILTR